MSTRYSPKITTDDLILYLDADNIKSYKYRNRIYDYGVWTEGSIGHIGQFDDYDNADQNQRIISSDPWGNDVILWRSYSGTTLHSYVSSGGIYCATVSIDNTKLYRISYWENRISNGSATYGRYYLGCNGYGSVAGVANLSSGTPNTNPYFWSTAHTGLVENQWVLIIGHIHPHTYTGTTSVDSGRYTVDGGKIANISVDYKWLPETTTARPRSLSIYQGNDAIIHHTCYPRMDVCDGTEPSINDLVSGKVDYLIDMCRNTDNDTFIFNGASYDDGSILLNGVNEFMEVTSDGFGEFNQQSFTIETWIYPSSRSGDHCIFSYDYTSHNNPYYAIQLRQTSNGQMFFGWNYGSSSRYIITGDLIPYIDTWYHIVAIYTSGRQELWVNGILEESDTQTDVITFYNQEVWIGKGNFGGYFDGKISNFKFYKKALSVSEILQNFNSMKNKFGL